MKGTSRSGARHKEVPEAEIWGVRSRSEVPNVKFAAMRMRRRGIARRARERLLSGTLMRDNGELIVEEVMSEWMVGVRSLKCVLARSCQDRDDC